MPHAIRTLSALLVIATLFFSQFAVAAHVCPMIALGVTEATNDDAAAPCQMASDSTALCQQHCTDGHRTVVDTFAALPIMFVPTYAVPIPLLQEPIPTAPSRDATLAHALGPPLAITHCCWLI